MHPPKKAVAKLKPPAQQTPPTTARYQQVVRGQTFTRSHPHGAKTVLEKQQMEKKKTTYHRMLERQQDFDLSTGQVTSINAKLTQINNRVQQLNSYKRRYIETAVIDPYPARLPNMNWAYMA